MSAQHTHRYEKVILGKNNYVVFRCNLPNCNHYIAEKLALGKVTICNRCGFQMLLDKRAMRLTKPHCVDCIQVRKKDEHDKLLEFLEKVEVAK